MIIQLENTKLDLENLKGYTRDRFLAQYKSVFNNPLTIWEYVKDKIPKEKKVKK